MKKAAIAIAVLGLALLALSLLPMDWQALRHGDLNAAVESLRAPVLAAGWMAWALFLGIFTMLPLLMVPVSILCIAGGLLFPWYMAFPLIWVGSALSAAASYLLAHTVGRRLVERFFLARLSFLRGMDEGAGNHGFKASFLSRYLPFPYVFPGYAAGLSSIRFWDFVLGSALGMLPWSLFYALAAHSLIHASPKTLSLVALGFAALAFSGVLVRRRLGLGKKEGQP